MLHHSRHKAKLIIDGIEVKTLLSAKFNDNGNNQLQSLTAGFSDPDLEDMALFDKKVELFINNGSEDGAPIFRGYINQFTSSESKISIKALDPRMVISGKRAVPIVIDEKNNYDGHTIVQFLHDYIENNINIDETLITPDFLHEMDKPVYMTGVRGTESPYSHIQSLIQNKIDDETSTDRTDSNSVFDYSIDIVHGGRQSGLTIRKRRALDENADMHFKYGDGIQSITYNERAPPSYALGTVKESNEQVIFDYGNNPFGVKGMDNKKVEGNSRGELRENLIAPLMLEQTYTKEISIQCTKGYTLGIGNIIHIDVPKLNLYGNYAITAKNVSVGNTMSCTLKCNNKPIKLSSYLN